MSKHYRLEKLQSSLLDSPLIGGEPAVSVADPGLEMFGKDQTRIDSSANDVLGSSFSSGFSPKRLEVQNEHVNTQPDDIDSTVPKGLTLTNLLSGLTEAIASRRQKLVAILSTIALLAPGGFAFAPQADSDSAKGNRMFSIIRPLNKSATSSPSRFLDIHDISPTILEAKFFTFVGTTVLLDGSSNTITTGMPVLSSLNALPHSVVTTATCNPIILEKDAVITNIDYRNYVGLKGVILDQCAGRGEENGQGNTYVPLSGEHGFCGGASFNASYRKPCLSMNMEPGIILDGDIAANAVGLQTDQYANADELTLDESGVVNVNGRYVYYINRAIIEYQKGIGASARQLKRLTLNIKGGRETFRLNWYD